MARPQTLMSSSQYLRSAAEVIDILFADLVALPGVPHPIPFRTRSLSPPGPMVLRLKARESRSPPGPPKGYQTQSPNPAHNLKKHPDAGWSSPVARQAHNLKVTGSNPVPAPKGSQVWGQNVHPVRLRAGFFYILACNLEWHWRHACPPNREFFWRSPPSGRFSPLKAHSAWRGFAS